MAFDFKDGLAKVYTYYDESNDTGEFQFINSDGKVILGGKIVEEK